MHGWRLWSLFGGGYWSTSLFCNDFPLNMIIASLILPLCKLSSRSKLFIFPLNTGGLGSTCIRLSLIVVGDKLAYVKDRGRQFSASRFFKRPAEYSRDAAREMMTSHCTSSDTSWGTIIIIIIIITSLAPISSKIELSGATKPRD